MNGYIYLSLGALFIVWPRAVQTLFRDEPFAAHEEGLFRVIGMTVAVIGWLYLFGGRSNYDSHDSHHHGGDDGGGHGGSDGGDGGGH
jgi:hypothetical protein